MINVLDPFLEAYFYSQDLEEAGAAKEAQNRADALLCKKEGALIHALTLDLNAQIDSDQFDRILELADEYRKDEAQYQALVDYVEALRKK